MTQMNHIAILPILVPMAAAIANLVLGDMLRAMKEHRRFYENALCYIDQNSLEEFMREYTRTAYTKVLLQRIEERCLSEDLIFSIEFNSYGAVGMMSAWISGGMKEDPYRLAERIADNMPSRMKSYFRIEPAERTPD